MMDTPFVEKAIPMVSVDDKGKYVLTTQALNFFRAINGPIAVVSVAGLYRTGKSYLLNRVLLNRSNGFGVGPTINPCTKGLWCWGTPIKGTSTDGQPVNIVVIDTEGIGALDEDQTHDTKIFTLAILASSCFIYNSVGSIDQTAIQNLSLVVNLTKHIQLKSSGDEDQEGVDPDQISMYFPTFYWVVRDFSLQLQDPEGNVISSRQYLQKALAPQSGFTDDVQEKNRIRRLLTAFFKDRDCFTMIRPLVDEMKLQNLDKMDYDELRPEFVQQAMNFRKRIISSVKAKTLQNQKLNGTLYCSMMNSYVQSINEGAVPNIQNAWNYMCEQQCRRALEECYQIYNRTLHDGIRDFPKPEEDFVKCTSEAEDKALQAYRQKALGPQAILGYNQLKNRIRADIAEARQENINQSYKILREYIVKNAGIITKKLNSQQYSSYSDYEKQIVVMNQKFLKEGPKLHNYKYVYMEAVKKLSAQGAEFLFKNFTKQQEKTSEMFKQKEKQMSGDISTLRTECDNLRKKYNESMTEADQKIFELTNKEETLRKQLQITMKLKEQEQHKLSRQFQSKNSGNQAKYQALQERYKELTLELENSSRSYLTEQQGWLKEKAVFQQQVKYHLAQIEELQKKEKSLEVQISQKSNNMNKEFRETTIRFQADLDKAKTQLKEKIEKLEEMEQQMTNLKEELEQKTDKFEKKEKKNKQDLANAKREAEKIRRDYQTEKRQLKEQIQLCQDRQRQQLGSRDSRLRQSEKSLKELMDKLRIVKSQLELKNATLEQENNHNKMEMQSLKSTIKQLEQQNKRDLEAYKNSLEKESSEKTDKRIIQMKEQHTSALQNERFKYQTDMKQMMQDSNKLRSKLEQLQSKYNSLTSQKEQRQTQMSSIIEALQLQCSNLLNDRSSQENKYKQEFSQKESYFENRYRKLQLQFQEYKEASLEQYNNISSDSSTKLQQVRNHFAIQLENSQRRLQNERQRFEKKVKQLTAQHEKQFEEEKENWENQNEELNHRLQNLQELYRNTVNDYQHNNDMLNKQTIILSEQVKELKEVNERKEQQYNLKQMSMIEQHKMDKDKIERKNEELVTELNKKDRDNMNLMHQVNQLSTTLDKKSTRVNQLQSEITKIQDKYKTESQKLIIRQKEFQSQYLEKNSILLRDIALSEQLLNFQKTKVQEANDNLENLNKISQQKYNTFKMEKQQELKIISSKLQNERASIDSKYQQLKTTSKDMQMNLKKALNDAITCKTLLEQKLYNIENRSKESEESKNNEIVNLRNQLIKTRQNLSIKQKEYFESIKQLNQKIEKMQNEKFDVASTLDKERVLATQNSLMQQRMIDQIKRQSQEKIKKLQISLQREYSSRINERGNNEKTEQQLRYQYQNKYKEKINSLEKNITSVKNQYDSLCKEKENRIKELSQKWENEKRMKAFSVTSLEKKINQLTTNETKLNQELDKLKKQKNIKESEMLRKEQTEKENFKKKLGEYQNKVKEMTAKMNTSYFEQEKEKTKWSVEKETMYGKITEVKDVAEKYKKDLDKAKADIQKLKAKYANGRTTNTFIAGLGNKTFHEPKTEKPEKEKMMIQELNKENSNYQM